MPFDEVMHKFKKGKLHSGSKGGKKITDRRQAIAVMLSEKKKAHEGKDEYKSKGLDTSPSKSARRKHGV